MRRSFINLWVALTTVSALPTLAFGQAEGEVTAEERALIEASLSDATASSTAAAASSPNAIASLNAMLQSMNPSMSFIFDGAAGYFTTDEPRQVGAHDPNRTGFTFQQLELAIGANVDPFFRFDANLVFAEFGVEVEEAYATSLRLPYDLQLRAGQFLTRFGRINNTHPHSWSFMDQPLVNGKFFGGEGSRGLGLEISWLSPLPWYVELVLSANNPIGDCCARSFIGGSGLPLQGPGDLLYTFALKQFFPFDESWSLSFGLSSQVGPNGSGNDNDSAIYGTDIYLRYRPVDSPVRTSLTWQTEIMFRTRQVPFDRLQDVGMYSQIIWNLDLQWELGLRYEMVSGVTDDPLDLAWTSLRQRLSTQATFYPSHFARVRAQVGHDGSVDQESYWVFLLNLEVLIGAHGAHDF